MHAFGTLLILVLISGCSSNPFSEKTTRTQEASKACINGSLNYYEEKTLEHSIRVICATP